ncbi:MAG: aminodeoxychorismate synthase component I [Halothiobacillaceae bacterium]
MDESSVVDAFSTAAGLTVRRLDAPIDLLALHRAHPARYPHLLASSAYGTLQGRYDILLAHPSSRLRFDGVRCERDGQPLAEGFFDHLDAWWANERIPESTSPLPFHGGWFIYLGYELAHWLEPSVPLAGQSSGLPVALAERCPAAVIHDHLKGVSWWVEEGDEARLWPRLLEDCAELSAGVPPAVLPDLHLDEDAPEVFLDGVQRIREYILAGDIFQANLSRAWRGRFARPVEAADLFQRLSHDNPGPFAALSRIDDQAIISSSPERLVSSRHQVAQTRPIAGTRRRGADEREDAALKAELIGHPKERAEHIMLLDLERNDLGRVCRPGTVRVDECMVIETYRHVHHIVSNVRGELRPEVTPGQLLAALFPGGTITGCPKVRCMQILAELEGCARGPYTGSLGYLNRDGSLDTNILIRTIHLHGQEFTLRAGAGIVADSKAEAELVETRAKARGLLRALGFMEA